MKIYDVMAPFQRNIVKYDGLLGIEIETETYDPYELPRMKFWNTVADGSLRNYGIEYVLLQPLNLGKDLDAALDEFKTKTKAYDFIQDSISTSVHVHINFLNQTFSTLANFLTVYTLMENLLIKFSGPDRLSNLFCLPICDAEEIVENITTLLRQIDGPNGFGGLRLPVDQMKYGAINLASFPQRGSLEIRSFRGVTDTNTIKDWATLLTNMLEYAKREITPVDIVNQWRDTRIEMIEDVFGDKFSLLICDEADALVHKNLWYAARIASFTKDWSKFAQFEKKTKKGKKDILNELDNVALNQFGAEYNNLDRIQRVVVDEEVARQARPVNFEEVGLIDRNIVFGEFQLQMAREQLRAAQAQPPVPQWADGPVAFEDDLPELDDDFEPIFEEDDEDNF